MKTGDKVFFVYDIYGEVTPHKGIIGEPLNLEPSSPTPSKFIRVLSEEYGYKKDKAAFLQKEQIFSQTEEGVKQIEKLKINNLKQYKKTIEQVYLNGLNNIEDRKAEIIKEIENLKKDLTI